MSEQHAPPATISFAEAFRFWLKLGFISFGGPAGQIAIMHRELVEQRRWISDGRFLHALNYCMLLPGPEAQQLATYIGWLMHRTRGGLVAGGPSDKSHIRLRGADDRFEIFRGESGEDVGRLFLRSPLGVSADGAGERAQVRAAAGIVYGVGGIKFYLDPAPPGRD